MTDETQCDVERIMNAPANELIALSHEQLDTLINQVEETAINAALALNWLTLMKAKKEERERGSDSSIGGGHEQTL